MPKAAPTAKKTNKNSIKRKSPIKTQSRWREALEDMGVGNLLTMNDAGLENLGKEFVQHSFEDIDSKETRRLTFRRFFIERGIPWQTAMDWRKRNQLFDRRIKFGLRILGEKLHVGMLRKELEPQKTAFQLHNYLPEWKEYEKYQDTRQIDLQAAVKKAILDIAEKDGDFEFIKKVSCKCKDQHCNETDRT